MNCAVVRTGFEPVTSENPDWLQHIMLWPLSYLTIVVEICANAESLLRIVSFVFGTPPLQVLLILHHHSRDVPNSPMVFTLLPGIK